MIISSYDRRMARSIFKSRFAIPHSEEHMFYELCFCILAPQTTFVKNVEVVSTLKLLDFYSRDIPDRYLRSILKPTRFYRKKASYLKRAKRDFNHIYYLLKSDRADWFKREYLVEHVMGLGYKAASHLLRNLGAKHLAIIDTHILKYLKVKGTYDYEILENEFGIIAKSLHLDEALLDMIVWKKYSGTPWKKFIS